MASTDRLTQVLHRLQAATADGKRSADAHRPRSLRRDDSASAEIKLLPRLPTGPLVGWRDPARRSPVDELTGLPDRAGLSRLMSTLDSHAARSSGPIEMCVACLDLDHFRQVNDEFGTAAGDDVLRQVAARLRRATREDDVVMRLGGDEFLLLLPCSVGQGAELVQPIATRLLSALQWPMTWLTTVELQVGASVGAAVWRRGRAPLTTVIGHAEEALFAAKRAGRGRFRQYAARSARWKMGSPVPTSGTGPPDAQCAPPASTTAPRCGFDSQTMPTNRMNSTDDR